MAGTRAGQVVDLPVLSARAMLADGRASLNVEETEHEDTAVVPAAVGKARRAR